MEKVTISKQTEIQEDKAVITETTETKLSRENLEMQLRDLSFAKDRLKDENKRIIEEYRQTEEEEEEIKDLIAQLSTGEEGELEEI